MPQPSENNGAANNNPGPRPVMMSDLKDCLGDWTGRLSESLTKTLTASLTKDFSNAVSVVANSVADNTANIRAVSKTIKQIEKESKSRSEALDKKVDRLESVLLASKKTSENENEKINGNNQTFDILQVDMNARERNFERSERYSRSRRSLRMWPVPGSSDEEVHRSAIKFIRNKLLVGTSDLDDKQIVCVRRTRTPHRSKIAWEVLVTFEDKYARDLVSSCGRNLAEYVNDDGLPTAGLRLDYPAHLGAPFRLLDWYGKQMRERHGKGTRRSIKFDDEEESL